MVGRDEAIWLCGGYEDLVEGFTTIRDIDFQRHAYNDYGGFGARCQVVVLLRDFSAWMLYLSADGVAELKPIKNVPWEPSLEVHDLVRFVSLWESYKETLVPGLPYDVIKSASVMAAKLLSGVGDVVIAA